MTYLDLVTDIKTHLNPIPNIGVIHTYSRQVVDQAKFIELFKYRPTGQILGWEMHRRAIPEIVRGVHFRLHHFVLSGYMGLQDDKATSLTFQALCDKVCETLRTASPPDGAAWEYRNAAEPQNAPTQIENIDDRMFGNVLCHCAQISLVISEHIII